MKSALITLTIFGAMLLGALNVRAEIYVIKNRDGSMTFTSRKPREGQTAELFRPKKTTFSTYSLVSIRQIKKLFRDEFQEIIGKVATETNLDPSLIKAVIHAESGFNPKARSSKGAMGLMQLMPGTAHEVGVKNPYEPRQNIAGGALYLSSLMDRYQGDLKRALAAYNAGPGNVDSYNGIPPFKETREYVQKVMSLHKAYSAGQTL